MTGTIVVSPIGKVQQLRRDAQGAREVSEDGPQGWSKSAVDPMDLLAMFLALKLKSGYIYFEPTNSVLAATETG